LTKCIALSKNYIKVWNLFLKRKYGIPDHHAVEREEDHGKGTEVIHHLSQWVITRMEHRGPKPSIDAHLQIYYSYCYFEIPLMTVNHTQL